MQDDGEVTEGAIKQNGRGNFSGSGAAVTIDGFAFVVIANVVVECAKSTVAGHTFRTLLKRLLCIYLKCRILFINYLKYDTTMGDNNNNNN